MTKAPRIPQNKTRCWSAGGTANVENTTAKTKMLSTASAFSMRKPVRNSMPRSPEPVSDPYVEKECQTDPDGTPGECLACRHLMCLAMKDAEVKCQQR